MKRIALLTYYFPPDGGAGAQRPRSLFALAGECGYALTVVTRQPPAKRDSWEPLDATLTGEQPGVFRVPMPPQSTAGQMVPGAGGEDDPYLIEVARVVEREHTAQPFDAVVLTMPPYGPAPIAPRLKEQLGIPVFIDLQDPWALDGAPLYRNRADWARNDQWMRRVLSIADGVIVNTPEARTQLLKTMPALSPDRVIAVNNGCTVADFQGPMPARPAKMDPGRFHLVHTGTLHAAAWERTQGAMGLVRRLRNHRAEPADISGRTALHLLRAIDRLKRSGDRRIDNLTVSLVGVDDGATRRMIDAADCRGQVNLVGFVPYRESVAWIRHADALFVPLFGLPEGHRSRIVPSKTYEYLASGRPILGALPEGDARELVERSGRGVCANPCDDGAIAEALGRVIDLALGMGNTPPPVEPFVSDYDWRPLCRRFFAFLDRCLTDASAPQPA